MHYLISALLILSLTAQGANRKEEELFSRVPRQLRAQLTKRLALYIEYERRQDYGGLYNLLSNKTKNPEYLKKIGGVPPLQSKSSYIKFREADYPKVLDFTPQSLKDSNVSTYEIRGQATLRYKGGTAKQERILYVWLQDGEWFFSELNEELID